MKAQTSMRRSGLTTAAIYGYSLGDFAFAFLGLVVAAGLVAWSLLFARVFDAFVHPVMGWVSDHTDTRWGLGLAGLVIATMLPAYLIHRFGGRRGDRLRRGDHRTTPRRGVLRVSLVTPMRFQFTSDDLAVVQAQVGRG